MNNASLIDNDRQQDHGDWFERGGKKDYRICSPLADLPQEITGYKGEADSEISRNPFKVFLFVDRNDTSNPRLWRRVIPFAS